MFLFRQISPYVKEMFARIMNNIASKVGCLALLFQIQLLFSFNFDTLLCSEVSGTVCLTFAWFLPDFFLFQLGLPAIFVTVKNYQDPSCQMF